MKIIKAILNHSQFNLNDYQALKYKGYNNKKILEIWDRDKADGKDPVTINKYTVDWSKIRKELELKTSF